MSTDQPAQNLPRREGFISFPTPLVSTPPSIWYEIFGLWPPAEESRPGLTLHGGPGYTHDYLLSFADLCHSPANLTVIFFDQLGSGRSTHFREKLHDEAFWTEQFFLDQVTAVVNYLRIGQAYDVIGHSWGGMLGAAHAARQPQGLKHLVIAHAPPASKFWLQKYKEFRETMPEPHHQILLETRTIESSLEPRYLEAIGAVNRRFFMTCDPLPEGLVASYEDMGKDRTATLSCLGPDEFEWTGFMASWSIIDNIVDIKCKTLVLVGTNQGVDHDEAMALWRTRLLDHSFVKFPRSKHFSHWEERSKCMEVISEFLNS
ncbi:hypothetical protein A1O7_08410 [Cladophialophora yegresii CBS 114405]|uniref:AB hydrolase-1 domain-containing protein n=1 Tax=Cladophialophora yegresii CBS 114405 TaxID=1182544 RepID=W9VJ17_9EURO|nr:uncharacterized protein A1O7_08410 [Cladophialophora yegresii CBS 114405]EXJ55483.1 hypothetical protein A1O7_08410 [Cladophialophora yegresii CBS 114405]